jgi:hypothetical protein
MPPPKPAGPAKPQPGQTPASWLPELGNGNR